MNRPAKKAARPATRKARRKRANVRNAARAREAEFDAKGKPYTPRDPDHYPFRFVTRAKIVDNGKYGFRLDTGTARLKKDKWSGGIGYQSFDEALRATKSLPADIPIYQSIGGQKDSTRLVAHNPARQRRRNVQQGFHDNRGQFHPIRKSDDYDPLRAKETGSFRSAGRAMRKTAGKRKAARKNPRAPLRKRNATLWFDTPDKQRAAQKLLQARGIKTTRYQKMNQAAGRPQYMLTSPDASTSEMQRTLFTPNPSRKRNPAAEETAAKAMYESFHGRPSRKVTEYEEAVAESVTLAGLGKLLALFVFVADDAAATPFNGFGGCQLASTADGGQLYFVGGNQSLDLEQLGLAHQMPKDHLEIGEVAAIEYHTRKGFHDFEPIDYTHRFGEGGEEQSDRARYRRLPGQPTLNYDTRSKKLYLTGGIYQVRPEGIVN